MLYTLPARWHRRCRHTTAPAPAPPPRASPSAGRDSRHCGMPATGRCRRSSSRTARLCCRPCTPPHPAATTRLMPRGTSGKSPVGAPNRINNDTRPRRPVQTRTRHLKCVTVINWWRQGGMQKTMFSHPPRTFTSTASPCFCSSSNSRRRMWSRSDRATSTLSSPMETNWDIDLPAAKTNTHDTIEATRRVDMHAPPLTIQNQLANTMVHPFTLTAVSYQTAPAPCRRVCEI